MECPFGKLRAGPRLDSVPDPKRAPALQTAAAFTLIELLVVLVVIGVLASLTLPGIIGMRKNNTMVSAGRQLVDDIALARARAISERTVVHVVFVPPEVVETSFVGSTRDAKLGNRLMSSKYTGYALYAERTVGDQPGRPRFRYLTAWRALPEGVFIATNKFIDDATRFATILNPNDRPFEYVELPFPTVDGQRYRVPHLSFDPQGRLVDSTHQPRVQNEVIPLARGSIFYVRTPPPDGPLGTSFDVRESPRGNSVTNFHRIVVDGLTGRSRVETPQIE